MNDMLNSAPCGYVAFDDHGTILTINATLATLLGQTTDGLQGQRVDTLLSVVSRIFYQTHVFPLLKVQGKAEEIYLSLRSHSGQDLPMLLNAVRHEKDGRPVNVCVFMPMQRRDRYEDELLQAKKAAEAALILLERAHAELKVTQVQLVQSEKMRALGQLVAGVAHEVNNPAAFVSSNLAHCARLFPLLRSLFCTYAPLKEQATPEQRRVIEHAEENAEIPYLWDDLDDLARESQEGMERIRNIVLSLRNFSRLDEADEKEADLNEGVRNTVRIVRPLCKERVTIEERYADLPVVRCRPGELNQVFLNVLTNAMQAIDGPGHITITTEATPIHVVVTIDDTGSGMDEATLRRLGEPFFTTKPVGSGTGLGLALSFGIMERHHGHLHYESQPGIGTRARIELSLHHD